MSPPDVCARHPWVIVGCGYTGLRLARRLLGAGARVWATRRESVAVDQLGHALGAGAEVRALDLDDDRGLAALAGWMPRSARVVHAAPPGQPAGAGERALVAACAEAGAGRIVYLSSTGVYGPGDGAWVDEDVPVGPTSSRGQARLEAESALLATAREHGIEAVALRVAGIYGPGRGVPTRLHRGDYRVIGDGSTYVSRVHVDDLVAIVVAAATAERLPRSIYNVADDRPETSRVIGDEVAALLGVPPPPSVPLTEVPPWIATMMRANRRISNRRLKAELGIELAYPSWREGVRQIMAEDGIPDPAARAGAREL
ncbi:NAD-dependent epimerase/dehydratase family protein [Haliangium sp.]|uniref:NAD-dependent epimerase/dehydratase family protein n=1 Tax=Haliangium sp. TaxID=2663208 RepID=UPI003D143EE1